MTDAPVIVQYWHREDPPEQIVELMATFRERNPGMRQLVFNERTAAELIEERYGARHANAFRSCAIPAMQADYFRYCAVHSLGGVYADANFACVRELAPLLEDDGVLFEQPPLGPVLNGLFAFRRPKHPLLAMSIEVATRNIELRLSDNPGLTVGPAIFTGLTHLHRGGALDELRQVIRPEWRPEFDACMVEMPKSLHRAIEKHGPLAEAFEGVRISTRAEMREWAEKPELEASANPDSHWSNWTGSAFRTTDARARKSSSVDYCVTTMDRPEALERLLLSIATHRPEARVHVADQSERFDPRFHEELTERLLATGLRARPTVHRLPFDCGVSVARNHLADTTSRVYKLILDDDFVFTPRTDVEALVRAMEARPEAGAIGGDVVVRGKVRISACRLVKEAGTLRQLSPTGQFERVGGIEVRRTDCVPMFMLLRRSLYEHVRWDPALKTSGEHFDFFLRVAETPFEVLHTPDVVVEHPSIVAAPDYRRRRYRGEFLKRMMVKHGLRCQRAIGGAIFELLPDGDLIAYCELDRTTDSTLAADEPTRR